MIEIDTQAPAFDTWLDGFFAAYYRQRPVNATFIGVHDHDHLLPAASLPDLDAMRAENASLLSRLRALPSESLTPGRQIDRQLAEGFLRINQWELDSPHFVHGNPSAYTGEAIFALLSLFLRPFAPLPERIESAMARMEALPAYFAAARTELQFAPPAWTARALRECAGARAFLTDGIDQLSTEAGALSTPLRTAAARAAEAFQVFDAWLRDDLLSRPSDSYACGGEVLELLLRHAHGVEMPVAEIERLAADQVTELSASLREHAADFGAASPEEALAQLAGLHPTAAGYYAAYGEVWQAARARAVERDLVTWPDFPIEYVPQPAWARTAAPMLYFLFYRSPAPFDHVLPVQYLVTPVDPDMPPEEQERRLRATNDSVIKLNHVVHHGGLGHHVQNWHAFRAASRVGQIAAVDCAARIAMLCGGTMAEGWACYATDLMDEAGFLTPLEQYAEQHSRLRMAARALADIRLHSGRWTLEDTARFYQETTWMPAPAAESEAVKNSLFPGTAMMYLLGTSQIHRLRRRLQQRDRAFDLRRFHDRFLSYGSIPVALIARAMEDEDAE